MLTLAAFVSYATAIDSWTSSDPDTTEM